MKKILMTLTLAVAAMIAIPTAVNAQDAKPEQKKECCKEKKECAKKECAKEGKECTGDCKTCPNKGTACAKEGKACANEGKTCAKEGKACGKKMMHKAQPGKMVNGPRNNARMHRNVGDNPMFKGITLSEEQQQKLNALKENTLAKEKKAKIEAKSKNKEEIKKLREDFDKEVEKILDKDQLKQYKSNIADMEAKRPGKIDKNTEKK